MKMLPHAKKDLTPDDIAEFLKPLIDISTCDVTSITNLRRNRKEIISKLNETGRPVVLINDVQTLLLCDVKTYFELETRRRCITSRFKSIEDAIQIGKIDPASPRFVELEMAQREISELEDVVKSSKRSLKQAESKLPKARERLANLLPTCQPNEIK